MRRILNKLSLIVLSFFFFLLPITVLATSASASFSGSSTVYIGKTFDITFQVTESGSASGEGIAAIQGPLSYDSSKLELVSSKANYSAANFGGGKLAVLIMDGNYITGTKKIMTFTFKAKALGSATVSINADISDAAGNKIYSNKVSKSITITDPPSSNNYLKSLSVDKGSLSFNKNTTSYNVSVGSDIESISISASAEDSGAKVSGTGSKSLNYGNNKFDIVVTAPSGDKKTYTITVNRKDIRSSENALDSLSVGSGELSPKFSSGTTSYTLSVPYEVVNLKVTAKAKDGKAKVSISGNNNLVAESTQDVIVTVTAENGSKKTYTIKVTRGKDPNKKLSNNNYLTHLTASVGMISPVFNKDVTNYAIYLPYEIDNISFDYGVEDTKYATVKFEGNESLQPGTINVFKIIVKAESEEERVYTISVSRANKVGQTGNGNTYVKDVEIKKGILVGTFNKEKREYYYQGDLELGNIIPEEASSAISTFKYENTIYIIVQSSNGEYGVYSFMKEEFSITPYIINITILLGGFSLGFITHRIIAKNGKKINSEKKESKKV